MMGRSTKYIADFTKKHRRSLRSHIQVYKKNPPPSAVAEKHLQEFIDFATGANRAPIGFLTRHIQACRFRNIHALYRRSKNRINRGRIARLSTRPSNLSLR